MARKRAKLTDLLNHLTFRTLYDKYKLLATSAFEWQGLPEGIEARHIENYLFMFGKAIFFRDPHMSYMCLEAQDAHGFNVYGEPLSYLATGNGYHKFYDADDCVIIPNNLYRHSTHDFVMHYVNKLYEAERTMDVNVKSNKTPFIIVCDDKNVLTFKQLYSKIDGNEPVVFGDKGLNFDAVQVLQTGVPFICNELMDYKKTVENELLTFLGFNNVAIDKKERVNVSETNSNNAIIESFADLQLTAREEACQAINELYGLNVSVKRREVMMDVDHEPVLDDEGNGRAEGRR